MPLASETRRNYFHRTKPDECLMFRCIDRQPASNAGLHSIEEMFTHFVDYPCLDEPTPSKLIFKSGQIRSNARRYHVEPSTTA